MPTVYVMRHGKKNAGENPRLTERGQEQISEATKKYLIETGIKTIFCGDRERHLQSAKIVEKILEDSYFEKNKLLTSDFMTGIKDVERCIQESIKHPGGVSVGFRVDNWQRLNPDLMLRLKKRFMNFTKDALDLVVEKNEPILAISSSPLIEMATPNPRETWLLGEAGIIKYTLSDSLQIIEHKIIFEGFFEN